MDMGKRIQPVHINAQGSAHELIIGIAGIARCTESCVGLHINDTRNQDTTTRL
jgi:hypothetical protein